jgi:hypothetical protein
MNDNDLPRLEQEKEDRNTRPDMPVALAGGSAGKTLYLRLMS